MPGSPQEFRIFWRDDTLVLERGEPVTDDLDPDSAHAHDNLATVLATANRTTATERARLPEVVSRLPRPGSGRA